MSIETGVLISSEGKVIHWHLPADRSAGHIGDSRDLWDIIWENRNNLYGFAHSHPGAGSGLGPSWTDLTTFSGVEIGLGKRLFWPIINETHVVLVRYCGPNKYDYEVEPVEDADQFEWLNRLKELSYVC